MATLAQDNFNRNESPVTAGQVGPAPVALIGTFSCTSNALSPTTLVSGESILTWDVGTAAAEVSIARAANIIGTFGLVACVASATDFYYLETQTQPMRLWRRHAGGLYVIAEGGKNASQVGDRPWLSHNNGWLRAGINGVEALRVLVTEEGLPIPTSTKFGVRCFSTTWPNLDDLLIQSAPAVPSLVTTAQAPITRTPAAGPTFGSFLYRGRDLKTLDIAGGA